MVLSCNVMCQTCSKCSAMQCNVRWPTGHCLKPLICRHGQTWFSCETHFTASDHHGSTMAWYQQPTEKERQSQDKTHPWKSFQILRIIHPGWYHVWIFCSPPKNYRRSANIDNSRLTHIFQGTCQFWWQFYNLGIQPTSKCVINITGNVSIKIYCKSCIIYLKQHYCVLLVTCANFWWKEWLMYMG